MQEKAVLCDIFIYYCQAQVLLTIRQMPNHLNIDVTYDKQVASTG
jgi:hypothetical protein